MGERMVVHVAARDHGGGAVRESPICGTRIKRHLAADDARRAHLGAGGTHHMVEASALKIACRDRADAISVASISIYVVYIYIGNIHPTVEAAARVAASPPGVEDLERRQGTPAHVAKAEPATQPTTSNPAGRTGKEPSRVQRSPAIRCRTRARFSRCRRHPDPPPRKLPHRRSEG